jgi:hypothetical protein
MARPTKLTEATQSKIVGLIRAGNTFEGAALASGIHPATFYSWREKGQHDQEEGVTSIYSEFYEVTQIAVGESEAILVKYARSAAEKDGRIAIAMLERRFPDRWTQKHKVEGDVNVTHGGRVTHQIELPDDEARLREIGSVFGEIGAIPAIEGNGHSLLEPADPDDAEYTEGE